MPNRKIKHIVAKLVGASTEETLDVYDVDAIHTDKIYNALDQTAAGYVLDARQGKALNDSLNNKMQIGYLPNATTGTTVSSGQYISSSVDVTFSRPFGSTPSVILQEAGGNATRSYAYRINVVTKTGFSFWVVANAASYQPPTGSWIAIAN